MAKLAVSKHIVFVAASTLDDNGTPTEFGLKLRAERAEMAEGEVVTVGTFLADRAKLEMLEWVDGKAAVLDDAGQPAPASAQTLADVYELIPNTPGLVYRAYLDATGAKAKLGNSKG